LAFKTLESGPLKWCGRHCKQDPHKTSMTPVSVSLPKVERKLKSLTQEMSKILGDGSEFNALKYPGFSAQLKRKKFMSKDESANTNLANTCIERCPSMSTKARQKAFRVRSGSKQVINMNPLTHNRCRHVYADAIFPFESGLGTASSHSLSLRYLRILSCCSVSSSPTFTRN